MIQILKFFQIRDKAVGATVAAVFLASLSIPAQGKDGGQVNWPPAQPAAREEKMAEISSGTSAAVTPAAALSPRSTTTAPSLEEVVELLQAQSREIESLKAALRDQQELTARLEAKLNAATPSTIFSEAAVPAPPAPVASAGQPNRAGSVARLEPDLANSQENLEKRLKNFGPFVFNGDFRLRAEPTFGGPV